MGYLELGDGQNAERCFREALKRKPSPEVWVLLSGTLLELFDERETEARDCLYQALECDPNYDEAHYNLGCSLRIAGDWDAAEPHFRRALEIDPEYARAHAELGFLLIRDFATHEDRERQTTGLCHLQRSVELDPHYGWSHVYLGAGLAAAGRLREARPHHERACEIWPRDALTRALLGDFLSVKLAADAEAEKHLRHAVELDPEEDAARLYLGRHLIRVGRMAEARRELLEADRLGNKDALAALNDRDAIRRAFDV